MWVDVLPWRHGANEAPATLERTTPMTYDETAGPGFRMWQDDETRAADARAASGPRRVPAEDDETLGPCGCTDYHLADCPTRTGGPYASAEDVWAAEERRQARGDDLW